MILIFICCVVARFNKNFFLSKIFPSFLTGNFLEYLHNGQGLVGWLMNRRYGNAVKGFCAVCYNICDYVC
jgi:hypothetical protein